jgi:hypothetical protein
MWATAYYTVKKEKKLVLIFKEIQKGSGVKSYMRKGLLIHEMRKCANIYAHMRTIEEAVHHI